MNNQLPFASLPKGPVFVVVVEAPYNTTLYEVPAETAREIEEEYWKREPRRKTRLYVMLRPYVICKQVSRHVERKWIKVFDLNQRSVTLLIDVSLDEATAHQPVLNH